LIQANTRRGNEHAFRFGGDEFILLLENTTAAQAVALGERLAAMLAQQIRTLPPTDPRSACPPA
jgi:GGDEF domain-containing protein